MKRAYQFLLFLVIQIGISCSFAAQQPTSFKVLAFYSATWDAAHISFVKEANAWFAGMAPQHNFTYEATDNWAEMRTERLNQYDVILFLDNVPNKPEERKAFEKYILEGGGFIAFHVAAYNDAERQWDWYFNELLATGRYAGNTWKPTAANLRIEHPAHPIHTGLPPVFKSQPNEWYKWEKNLRENKNIQVLVAIDSSSFPLGTGPKQHEIWHRGDYPVVWTNTLYNILYINMGHNDMRYNPHRTVSYTFANDIQNKLVLNSLKWLASRKVNKSN